MKMIQTRNLCLNHCCSQVCLYTDCAESVPTLWPYIVKFPPLFPNEESFAFPRAKAKSHQEDDTKPTTAVHRWWD